MTNTFRDSERARAAKQLIRRIAVLLVFALCIGMFAAQAGADEGKATVRISFGTLPDFSQWSVKDITIGLYKVGVKKDDGTWDMITNRLSSPDTAGYNADAEVQKASQYISSTSLECVTSTVDQSTGVAVFDSNLDPGFYFGTLISGPEDFSMSSFFVAALTSIEFSMEPKWSLVTSATVTKKWEDDSDRDGKRKSVEVKLFKKIKGNDASEVPYIDKSGKEPKEVTAKIDSDTTFTVNNLPKYVDPRTRSTLYVYEWKETTTIDGYTVEPAPLTGPDKDNYANAWVTSLVNKHTPERINLEIHKRWVDKSGAEIDPPSVDVSVDLYWSISKSGPWQKYNDKPYVLNASNNWSALVNDLYAYQGGKLVKYRWVEKAITDYTLVNRDESLIVSVDNLDDAVQINGKAYIPTELENQHDDEKTRHTVVKFWSDESDQDGLRDGSRENADKVKSITIKLLKNGEEVKGKAVELKGDALKLDSWTYTWDNLDRYTNGKENVYTCEEEVVPKYYTMSVSPSGSDAEEPHYETLITNTHIPETVDLTIEKVWKGDEKYPAYRKPITVIIHNNVVGGKDSTVTLSANNADPTNSNRWVYVLKNLPKYSKGQEIEYSVAEVKVDGYTTSITKSRNKYQFTITNTLDVVSFSVTKEWDDGNNVDGLRNKIEIQLLGDGKEVSKITLPKNGNVNDSSEENWVHRWEEMPRKNEKGETINYEVKELTSLSGYGKAEITGNTTTGFRITNPHTPYTGSLRIRKNVTVNGESTTGTAADGTYSFVVTGPNNYSRTVEIAVTNGRSGTTTINDLTPGTYTVTEEVPSDMTLVEENGRSVTVEGNNTSNIPTVAFTNNLTVEPSLGSLRIRKSVTVNGSATRGTRADGTYSFTVTGPNNYNRTVEITITNGASRTVRISDLTPGTYTVTETVPSNMTLVGGNGKTAEVTANNTSDIPLVSFTNNRTVTTPTPTPPTTTTPTPVVTTPPSRITTTTPTPTRTTVTPTPSTPRTITGSKVWVDDNNSHNTRPSSISLHLYANDTEVSATPTWSSTDGDVWSYTYTGLPSVDSAGRTITYTVREESVPGYNGTVNGFTITNRLVPQPPQNYISVSGQKSWADDANAEGLRPGYITVRLYRNGTEIDSRNVTAGTGWSYTFASLPADDGYGNVYTYTVREDGVPGYYARQDGFNLTNYRLPPTTTPPPTVPRTSSTPPPAFETLTEENLEDLLDIFDYDTPLWGGLLGTGDTIPVYPFVFGGIGIAALLVLIIFGRRRKDEGAAA